MRYSEKINCIKPSLTRQLFDLAQGYDDVIDLTLGDPDIIPPQNVRDATCKAIQEGKTRYSANAGLMIARKTIADFNSEYYGGKISPEEIMLTVGGMEAVYLSLACILNPGDEVIIPAPYWINYVQMTKICGGVPVIVYSDEKDNFAVQMEQLKSAVTSRTKAIILNSPNNPTGSVLSKETLNVIADLAIRHDLLVISDEVYKTLIYDQKQHHSIFTLPEMKERTVVIDSMSKHFSMTGWRLGYAIAPPEFVKNMAKLQENVAACAPLPSQYAAVEAYRKDADYSGIRKEFALRRDIILRKIKDIPKISLRGIDATFYAFVNIAETKLNSLDFAMNLLKEQHVAVVPGRTYGENYDNYIRIAFTLKAEKLLMALERIKKFVSTLG